MGVNYYKSSRMFQWSYQRSLRITSYCNENYKQKEMYVTRPLSLYKNFPEYLSAKPEGPNSGVLVFQDEEYDATCCCFTYRDDEVIDVPFPQNKDLSVIDVPFPQNKDLSVRYTSGSGEHRTHHRDDVIFIPVLDQPLSSNYYYVIKRDGKHKGEAFKTSKKEECCFCCSFIPDAKPTPLDPSDIDHQIEIIRRRKHYFQAKSLTSDEFPPSFLRRKGWRVKMSRPKHYQLTDALGVDITLRPRLPEFHFPIHYKTSDSVVVGKWYCPFMFVKEELKLKDQMKTSRFYEMTLEQRWERILERDNNTDDDNKETAVHVDVVVQTEKVDGGGEVEAVWDEGKVEDGVVWFRSYYDGVGMEKRVGLSVKIVERMKWEEERVGWVGVEGRKVRVERVEEFGGEEKWVKFGCYVLVESFVLKRMDGSLVLSYDFMHTHQIRTKWE